MKIVKRSSCVMCDNNTLVNLFTLERFPIYMGTTTSPWASDLNHDMKYCKCDDCGTVQLSELIPLEILYKQSHAGIVGSTWRAHHDEFCKFAAKYAEGNILEIGGSNLYVANKLAKNDKVKEIKVVDNKIHREKLESDKILPVEEFFDAKMIEEDTRCVIHTHLIEHLYEPLEEFKKIREKLPDNAYMIFAAPLIDKMLEDYFTNAMNFEHTYLLSEDKIEYMMARCGFEMVEKMHFSQYAAFYVCKKVVSTVETPRPHWPRDETIITSFVHHYTEEIEMIKARLKKSPDKTFIFGGHVFTQYLLGFGLEEDNFCNILDNDPNKIGNRLYGTHLLVQSPHILKDIEEPDLVLKAAQYTEEIKQDIVDNINPKTQFIL